MWASPQSWAVRPEVGGGEIGGHHGGSAAEEREWRDEHPAVADRHQIGHARRGLPDQQLDRV